MLDFHQKRKVRSFMYNKVTLVILFLLVLVLARSTWVVWQKKQESEEMKSVSMRNVEELRSRESELQAKMNKLDTDHGIEEEIRAKYSVVKEGENMVVVVEAENTEVATGTPKLGFWQKIGRFFTGE